MAKITLSQTHPDLTAEWHPTKNGNLTADRVSPGSATIVWWLGKCGHEWRHEVRDRVRGLGCRICASIATTHPDLAAEWHPTKNDNRLPEQFTSGSEKVIWWLGKCGHEWQSNIYNRKIGSGCPYCSGQKVIVGKTDLETTHPEIAKSWSSRNLPKTPKDVSAGVGKRFWWVGECGHEWQAQVIERVRGRGCSICSGKKVVVGINDFASLFPDLAQEWHYLKNGDKRPEDYPRGTQKVFWWLGKCGHEWEASIRNRVLGHSCLACAGKVFLVGFNDLETTSPALAAEWHPTKNQNLTPDQVSKGLAKRVWWLGACGHEWFQSISTRIRGSGCPKCASGGYRSTEPGTLYFLHNPEVEAFKVGITNTNQNYDRISQFGKKGWRVLNLWESESGWAILNCETSFFQWLRREKQIPVYLDKETIGAMGGETETFSDSIISKQEVIAKIEELIKVFRGQENE